MTCIVVSKHTDIHMLLCLYIWDDKRGVLSFGSELFIMPLVSTIGIEKKKTWYDSNNNKTTKEKKTREKNRETKEKEKKKVKEHR